jgi:hypothetical protein
MIRGAWPGIVIVHNLIFFNTYHQSDWLVIQLSKNTSNCLISLDSCNLFLRINNSSNKVEKINEPIFYGGISIY